MMARTHHNANTDRAVIAARDTDATTGIATNTNTEDISILYLKLVLPRVHLLEVLSSRGQFLVRGTTQRNDNDFACKAQSTGLVRSYSSAR